MTIGRLFGIPIRVDWSWLLVFALFVWAIGQPSGIFAHATPSLRLGAAIVTIVLLFVCVVAHELAHALTARRFGAAIREIELFAFGGVSRIDQTGTTPLREALIALAGPAASVAIALVLAGFTLLAEPRGIVFQALGYLTTINLVLAAFNMLPSYPLDGARVLHAVVWAVAKRRSTAVSAVSATSTIVGLLLVAASFALFFSGYVTSGVWTAFLAWFIMRAARAETTNELYVAPLAELRCAQIADDVPEAVPPDTAGADALARLIASRRRAIPVAEAGTFIGIVTLSDFAKLAGDDLARTAVRTIMTPRALLVSVEPSLSALDAFRKLSDCGFHQLPVIENGELLGFISGETFHRALTFAREQRAILPTRGSSCVHS